MSKASDLLGRHASARLWESGEPSARTRWALASARHLPTPDVRDIEGVDRAVAWHTVPVPDVSSRTTRFVGRQRELQVLDDVLAEGRAGEGRVVLVTGAAGIGKTRFCREVAARARRGRYTVAWGSCWPVGGAPPLWPWQEILGGPGEWAAATLAADGGGYGVRPGALRPVRRDRRAGRRDVRRSPMLIVIDDIDAADTGALLLTRFVARTLARRRLVMLLTRRTEPGDAIELSPAWTVENEALLVRLTAWIWPRPRTCSG